MRPLQDLQEDSASYHQTALCLPHSRHRPDCNAQQGTFNQNSHQFGRPAVSVQTLFLVLHTSNTWTGHEVSYPYGPLSAPGHRGAVLPFYMLHQPIILMIAFWVIGLRILLLEKPLIIAILSFAGIMLLYEGIRWVGVLPTCLQAHRPGHIHECLFVRYICEHLPGILRLTLMKAQL